MKTAHEDREREWRALLDDPRAFFLLEGLALLKLSGAPLPDGRVQFEARIGEAFLQTIDQADPRGPSHGPLPPCTYPRAVRWLSIMAIFMQQRRAATDGERKKGGAILATAAEIYGWLAPVIASEMQSGEPAARRVIDDFLRHLADRSGLLQPRGEGAYGFAHVCFLEYFAACYLGSERERLLARSARQLEAREDGVDISEAELDRAYPPGPLPIGRRDFPALAAHPAWHEVVVRLIGSRPTEKDDLLRWLFPALHASAPPQRHAGRTRERLRGLLATLRRRAAPPAEGQPLLPQPAADLAARLAGDERLAWSEPTRRAWWRRLWCAYLTPSPGRVAPVCTAPVGFAWPDQQDEALDALADCLRKQGSGEIHLNGRPPFDDFADSVERCELRHIGLHDCLGLSDLSPLDRLTELEGLVLDGCPGVRDLAPLQGLAGLRELHLIGCTSVSDLAPLHRLARLFRLFLNDCTMVRDLAPLHGLAGLEGLYLAGCTGVRDLAPLRNLAGLRVLQLSGCTGVRDLAPLRGLAGLQYLYLRGCTGVGDLTPLQGLAGLQMLDLDSCTEVRDLAPLQGLTGLGSLSLYDCTGVSDLAPLQGLAGLHGLSLDGCTGVSDLAPLQGLAGLQGLSLHGCTGVSDWSVARGLKKRGAHVSGLPA